MSPTDSKQWVYCYLRQVLQRSIELRKLSMWIKYYLKIPSIHRGSLCPKVITREYSVYAAIATYTAYMEPVKKKRKVLSLHPETFSPGIYLSNFSLLLQETTPVSLYPFVSYFALFTSKISLFANESFTLQQFYIFFIIKIYIPNFRFKLSFGRQFSLITSFGVTVLFTKRANLSMPFENIEYGLKFIQGPLITNTRKI